MSSHVEKLLAKRDVQGLCRLLRSRDPSMRRRAAQALETLAAPSSIPCLARTLQEETDLHTLRYAADALSAIGNPAAIEILAGALYGSNRTAARLAEQALDAMKIPKAAATLKVRDALLRTDWATLEALDSHERQAFGPALGSPQFFTWPSAKQRRVLEIAVAFGLTPPPQLASQLKEMGFFLSGIHRVGDVLDGLRHRNPVVRIAAVEKLESGGYKWAVHPLRRVFRREVQRGVLSVAAAAARAMARLGDARGIDYYKEQLRGGDERQVVEAAKALVQIGTQETIETLFWFLVSPPAHLTQRLIAAVAATLSSAGSQSVDHLRPLVNHPAENVRQTLVGVIAKSEHPETVALLGKLACDTHVAVQNAALQALGALNSPDAAHQLHTLIDIAPQEGIVAALANITHPEATATLKALGQPVTELHGVLTTTDDAPVENGCIQCVQEHHLGKERDWGWQPVGPSTQTGVEGEFYLPLMGNWEQIHLKVTLRDGGEAFVAPIALRGGRANQLRLRVDNVLQRLFIHNQ